MYEDHSEDFRGPTLRRVPRKNTQRRCLRGSYLHLFKLKVPQLLDPTRWILFHFSSPILRWNILTGLDPTLGKLNPHIETSYVGSGPLFVPSKRRRGKGCNIKCPYSIKSVLWVYREKDKEGEPLTPESENFGKDLWQDSFEQTKEDLRGYWESDPIREEETPRSPWDTNRKSIVKSVHDTPTHIDKVS